MAGQKREARLARAFAQMSRPSSLWRNKEERHGCPAPVFAFGFDPARRQGAPKLS
jgi:hypothetical protein